MTKLQAAPIVAAASTGLFTGPWEISAPSRKAPKGLAALKETGLMRRSLGVAHTHPLDRGLVTASTMLAPVVALLLFRGEAGYRTSGPVLPGLASVVAGPVLASRLLAERIYDVFLSWKAEPPPEGWQKARPLPPSRGRPPFPTGLALAAA